MFRRFMIVCWVLFTVSVIATGAGFLWFKVNRDAALEIDPTVQPEDSAPDVYYVRLSLKRDQSRLEQLVAARTELDRRFTERRNSADPVKAAENKEKLDQSRQALANANDAVKRLAKLESRLDAGAATGVYAGMLAAALLLWNLLCHTVAWVLAGREKNSN